VEIDNRSISNNSPPYIIAEMSANHNGSIDNAFKIIDMAKVNGADAVKMQTYTPDTITMDMKSVDFKVEGGLWDGQYLYDLYEEAHTPWSWHKPLFEYAKKIGITIFSSPFDNTAVDLLESLGAPAYKIASCEAIDLPLIKYVARTGKPMIISTGMADAQEIQDAIDAAKEGGCKELSILHCVSGYPAPSSDYNLRTMVDMQQRFGLITGLSDHTVDNTTAIASVALGATIIEKHITLNRNGGGPDDSFSLEAKELKELCEGSKRAWQSLGSVDYGLKSSEYNNIKFRRSLYCVKDIKKGDLITKEHIKSIRPGFGLAPKYLEKVLTSRATRDIFRGNPILLESIS
jgi:pseudaminic acid synthase